MEKIHGAYGEFTVLVDGRPIMTGGALSALGILPTLRKVVQAVREHLAAAPAAPGV